MQALDWHYKEGKIKCVNGNNVAIDKLIAMDNTTNGRLHYTNYLIWKKNPEHISLKSEQFPNSPCTPKGRYLDIMVLNSQNYCLYKKRQNGRIMYIHLVNVII